MGLSQSLPQRAPSRRASRSIRPEASSPLIVQPRDREILEAVYGHRFLSSGQIRDMFFGCATRSNIRLRKLWEHEYVDRHYLRPLVFHGSSQAIYSLGKSGVDVVAESLDVDREEVRKNRHKVRDLKPFFIEHVLSVNDFRINFETAAEKHQQVQLERWINEIDLQDEYETRTAGRLTKRLIRPDGYGRYSHKGKLYSFFLELDRATETNGRFERKARSYLDYGKSGRYPQTFGVRFFRVLVVTTTLRRLKNLKATTQGFTHGLFWFTTLDKIRKGEIFGPIWIRSGQEGQYSLLDEG